MRNSHKDFNGTNNPFYGKKHTDGTKNLLRLKCLERLENQLLLYGKILMPFFNKKACDYFDKMMIEKGCNIQHALNGGEFYIKELSNKYP